MHSGYISIIIRFFVLLLVCGLAPPVALALDPTVGLTGYRHERWGEVDGAPSLVDAMAQTEDGWLWLASRHAGLYRFDGVRFIAYASSDGSRPQNVGISAMHPGSNNSLWIGHGAGGVSVLRGQRIHHVLKPDQTRSVFAIARGHDNSIWVASGRGLYQIRDDIAMRIDQARGYEGTRSEYVMADSQGRIWSSDGSFLYVLEKGQSVFSKLRKVSVSPMLIESPDGSIWLVTGKRFERVAPAATHPGPMPTARASSYQSGFDEDGNLWSGNCPVGLCVVRPAAWENTTGFDALASTERLDQPWQMSSLSVLSVFIDREGSVWIGTAAGIDRLRDQPIRMVGELMDRGTVHALPHPDGRIVVVEKQRLAGLHALSEIVDGRLVRKENPLDVEVMGRAPDGSLVLAGSRGIERHSSGGVSRIPLPPVPQEAGKRLSFLFLAAGDKELWLRIGGHGTWRFVNGKWTQFSVKGLDRPEIAMDKEGRVYLGSGSRLAMLVGEKIVEIAIDNPDFGTIMQIHAGEQVIVSGTGGIGVVKNNQLDLIQFAAGKTIGQISGTVRGPNGQYWINSSQGLLRASAADWDRTMRNPEQALKVELLDALDGYTGGGEAVRLNDTAFLARDGRLWLAGERGLAWLDPGMLRPNRITANVEILGLTSNGRRYLPGSAIRLGDGAQDLQIEYASPSLRIPQRVRFQYRMAGADRQWVDAGTRRTAFYQNLAPGHYTFEVVAINESGVPSPQAGRLTFEITPQMTQTWWFYTLCAAVALVMLLVVYRIRMRHLAARLEERFEIRASERESIARALHDTFLQSLQGLFFSMQAVMSKLPPNSPARVELGVLLERARRVLAEGRDEVKGLRSEFGSGDAFWEVLQRDIALIVPNGCERVELTGPGGIDSLQPQIHHNVYAVVREAVVNALRHTGSKVFVHTSSDPKAFVMSVTDHGPGLGPHKAGKSSHYGLQGMREHAVQIGGRLDIDDVEAGGTRVTLTVPAKLAYATPEKNLKAG